MIRFPLSSLLVALLPSLGGSAENLLLNADFRFTSFEPLRSGKAVSNQSGSVPFWESNGFGQVMAIRSPAVSDFRPKFPVESAVKVLPGGTLSQWVFLSEARLDPGDLVSFAVDGFQPEGALLSAQLNAMMTDRQEGEWSPADYGQSDKRTFPKAARGELTPLKIGGIKPERVGPFELKVEGIKLPGIEKNGRYPIAVEVVFTNTGTTPAWIYAPRLVRGGAAPAEPATGRALPDHYRSLPRTVSKLHAGEPLHMIVMGSSIDRASANPPVYRYDEDPASPTFKQPLSKPDRLFDGNEVSQPALTPYYGWWAHYYSYAGRLRRRLMNRFDLPPEKLLVNFMACDGSSIGEAHSGLRTWATLALPPSPEANGHQRGKRWRELYPGLFSRVEGPRPDLVIFGSGANERIDGADEVAVYEGAVRWFQRHYPDTEFVIAMWNNQERYSRGAVMMRQLALRYGLPIIDVGRELHLMTRPSDALMLTPKDGHPQAAAHDLWGRFLERAFQMADPMEPGLPQTRLPERISPYTVNWEGEMTTFAATSPRIYANRAFIAEDAAFNLWARGATGGENAPKLEFQVNGLPSRDTSFGNGSRMRPQDTRDERNSVFALGRLPLGERHLVELTTPGAKLVAVDAKTALNRSWHGVSSPLWEGKPDVPVTFQSEWGAPYGTSRLLLEPGQRVTLSWVGTLASVAWLQQPNGGTLIAKVNDGEPLQRLTGAPTKLAGGTVLHMEDRGALPMQPYGAHRLEVTAEGGPVALLGAFTYDTRPNRNAERTQIGFAAPGDRVTFSAPYAATPVVLCHDGLKVESVSREAVTFGGGAPGSYQVIGQ